MEKQYTFVHRRVAGYDTVVRCASPQLRHRHSRNVTQDAPVNVNKRSLLWTMFSLFRFRFFFLIMRNNRCDVADVEIRSIWGIGRQW